MATQQQIDAIKAKIVGLERRAAALAPALQAAKTRENAAQSALDAFQRTTSIADLVRARGAAEADPNNAQLQQQLAATQESFNRNQAVFVPLLRARDAAGDAVIEARSAIIELETQAGDLDVEIVALDPAQASPEAVAFAKENGKFPASPDDPVVQRQIAAETTQVPLLQPQQPVDDDPAANQFVFDGNGDPIPADSAQAQEILAEQNRVQQTAPAPVDLRNWRIEENDGTGPGDVGTFFVVDQNGEIFRLNIATRAEAESALREAQTVEGGGVTVTPINDVRNATAQNDDANAQAAILEQARAQAALNERRRQANQGDWRVKLRLAPLANYLYKAQDPGILEPLRVTDGVIFPYTPKIDLSYRAMYDTASLTHANYNSYFYKNSMLDPVNITATFTAQDTAEANYMLAVIHFFRSVTKMFYGQDAERGAPPPLVFFTGLGEFQFAEHPCVVHQFNYSLPSDVDYIRARSIMDPGTDLQTRRARTAVATTPLSFALKRLQSLGQLISPGAETKPRPPPTLGQNSPTYVPTRIDVSLILYPIQSRTQVSNQFSLQQYANGDLLKGGFW